MFIESGQAARGKSQGVRAKVPGARCQGQGWAGRWQFFVLLALFVYMPLPLASNRTWALALLALMVSLLALWHVWTVPFSRGEAASPVRAARLPLWLMGCWLLVLLLQVVPIPLAWHAWLDRNPGDGFPVLTGGMAPLSVDPYSSHIYVVRAWVLAVLFWLVLRLVDTRQRVEQMVWVLLFSGVLQALLAVVLFATGAHYSLFFVEILHGLRAKGTFVYHNHFAGYMEMLLALGIGLMVAKLDGHRVEGWRKRAHGWLSLLVSSKAILRLMLVVMVIGLIASRSRMGNSAFFISLLVVGVLGIAAFYRAGGRTDTTRSIVLFITSLVVLDVVIVGGVVGIEKVMHRIEATNLQKFEQDEAAQAPRAVSGDVVEGQSRIGYREESVEERVGPGLRALKMVQDFPWLGTGGNTFFLAYFPYRPVDVTGFYDHTHNDYIEFVTEVGWLGMVVLLGLVGHSVYRSLRILWDAQRDQFARGMGFASLMGVLELAIHSGVDFNLQNLTNAALFLVVLGLPYLVDGSVAERSATSRRELAPS